MDVTTIGIDLAKQVFQVHGVDAGGGVVVRKALRRAQVLPFFTKLSPCLVGMEACGTSHHWARELIALGHTVKMMPPAYVKAYVKRGKTDAADAEAICEAVTRPTMRFVPIKSREQQAALSMHRARNLLVKQRTQSVNMMRGLLAEFGINIPEGLERALTMAREVLEGQAPDVPVAAVKIISRSRSKRSTRTLTSARSIALSRLCNGVTTWHDVWQRSPALARSGRRRWPRPLPTRVSSVQADSLRPGLV